MKTTVINGVRDGKRYMCRERGIYKGVSYDVSGTSLKGRAEAKCKFIANKKKKIAEIDNINEALIGNILFKDNIAKWYNLYERLNKKEQTIDKDLSNIKLLNKIFGNKKVNQITADDLQAYFNQILLNNPDSRSVYKQRKSILTRYFAYVYSKRINDNPMNMLTKPPRLANKKKKDSLTDEEIKDLTDYLLIQQIKQGRISPTYEYGKALVVTLYCFLRIGQLQALKVKNIDFERNCIHIENNYYRKEHKIITTKTSTSNRDIPIHKNIKKILLEQTRNKTDEDFLFCNQNKQPLRYKTLHDTYKNALKALNIDPDRKLHDLRHDGISYMIRHNIPLDVVQRWAGHSDIRTTAAYQRTTRNEQSPEWLKVVNGDL